MKEDLLQFIWKFQYFNRHFLEGVNGEKIVIIHPGTQNNNQGPDFLNAKVKINDTLWAGNVEIHDYSRQWNQHRHQEDANYQNVILHVVWKHDAEINDPAGNPLPTLELHNRVSSLLLQRYEYLMEVSTNQVFIPCENQLADVPALTLIPWKHRLLVERLIEKSQHILEVFEKSEHHWEETFWRLLASNFGMRVNRDAFQTIAESLPQAQLARHKHSLIEIEALLFGQAGLLENNFEDKYPAMLQREYLFYQKKYKLQPVEATVKFLRMRPANFPTLRLAQLAALICKSIHLFSKVKDAKDTGELKEMLVADPNDYWLYHYRLEEETHENKKFRKKTLGTQMIHNIIINTMAPIIFAYGLYHNEQKYKDKALTWLEELPPERNAITRGFKKLDFPMESAFDSQAWIQLKNEYCNKRRCLHCAIGNKILQKE